MKFLRIIRRIFFSFGVILKSVKYILRNIQIWPLLILPFILNLILSIVIFIFFYSRILELINSGLNYIQLEDFAFIPDLARFFGIIFTLIIVLWFFLLMGMIISAPFNGIIIEKILKEHRIQKVQRYKGVKLLIFEMGRAIKFEFIKILLTILIFIVTSLINLIPVVGNIFFVCINYGFNIFINILDLTDPSFERIHYSFKQKATTILSNVDLFIIFGLISTLLFTIPVVNFLYIPIASISATFLFIKIFKDSNNLKSEP
ncbi:hypothetical protein GF362_06710 [Candidatus Dojkabacteria bacterium]|nr:hypothetical protein [Candidatus Dojkabacteria bacterium]